MMGGLRLDSCAGVLAGGKSGPAVVPGKPEESLLVQAVSHTHERLKMPPQGKLKDEEIADLTAWVKADQGDKDVFKCVCHNSEFDPRQGAQVVFGPAQRRLAALPLATADGALTVAATFLGKVGAQPGG